MWNWLIYGALIAGAVAVVAASGFLAVRILQGWRMLKRLRRHLAKELERLADLGDATADKIAAASDTAEIEASVSRLRTSLARLAVLRAAIDEVRGTFGPLAAVLPRK
jgi:hypothetical protein